MNTNIKYKGRIYHIQTEDGGEKRPTITSLLFKDGGVVVSSKRRDYSDLLQGDSCRENVSVLMKEQHKTMIRQLLKGEIEGIATSENIPRPAKDSPKKPRAKNTISPVKNVPEAEQAGNLVLSGSEKDLDALIVEYLSKKGRNVL